MYTLLAALLLLAQGRAAYSAEQQESRLAAFWAGLDPAEGVYLQYFRHTDYLDSNQQTDVHAKGESFYSLTTISVPGLEVQSAELFLEGNVYSLSPKERTAILITSTSSPAITANVLILDHLCLAISDRVEEKEFTVETREVEGVSYYAEVYPAGELTPEGVFCFDAEGQLAWYLEGARQVGGTDLGETVYRIDRVETTPDESLFDLSDYEVETLN